MEQTEKNCSMQFFNLQKQPRDIFVTRISGLRNAKFAILDEFNLTVRTLTTQISFVFYKILTCVQAFDELFRR